MPVQDTLLLAVDPDKLANHHNVADEVFMIVSGDQEVLKQTDVTSTGHIMPAVDLDTPVNHDNGADVALTLVSGDQGVLKETDVSAGHVIACCRPRILP